MEHPSLTSQTTAVFKGITNLRMTLPIGHEESPGQAGSSTSLLWVPACARTTDKETGHSLALVIRAESLRLIELRKTSQDAPF